MLPVGSQTLGAERAHTCPPRRCDCSLIRTCSVYLNWGRKCKYSCDKEENTSPQPRELAVNAGLAAGYPCARALRRLLISELCTKVEGTQGNHV